MPVTTGFSEPGYRYQLILRGECGPLTAWLFGDAAIESGGGCTVIIRSLSPMARRIVKLRGLDLANLRELSLGQELQDWLRDGGTTQQELTPVEPGTPFLAGTEGCP